MSRIRAASPPPLLLAIMAVGLVLRLWGHRVGLPWVYNVDEAAHFVPRAVGMFDHAYDPGYFINPPGLTYVLHAAFWLRWGGDGTRAAMAADPGAVYAYARVIVAVLSALSIGALWWAAARLFEDRRVAPLAAGLLAVAFLPVHYGHFALNDAALLLPACLALAGAAGIARGGPTREYVLAGAALGVAAAFKYTAGILLLPLLAAAWVGGHPRRLPVALGCAVAGFLALNPYALLSFQDFADGLREQSAASSDGGGKLGLEQTLGVRYYFETTLWGLGVVPVLAGLAGGALLLWRDRRRALLLLPAPVAFVVFMGLQDRFFARWLLPIYPLLILLAVVGALAVADRLPRRRLAVGLAAVALTAQGAVYAVHNDVVMTRPDTRAALREWMLAALPAGTRIVLEPIAPQDFSAPWMRRATSHFLIRPDGRRILKRRPQLEDYPRTLRPDLLDAYRREGYCTVITGSIIAGRAAVTPQRAPYNLRYYAALRDQADVVFRADPGVDAAFSFDDAYNWRPLGYERPGPRVVAYRLRDCDLD